VESFCDKSWVISSGGKETFKSPALYLKKHLDYNLQTAPGILLKDEMNRISRNRVIISKPTIAYQINEAKLLAGVIYKSNFRVRTHSNKESLLNFYGYRTEESEGLSVNSWSSCKYFGHWIHDELPRVLVAEDLGIPSVRTKQQKFLHQTDYEQVLDAHSLSIDRAIFSKLIILSDSTLNKYRQNRFIRLRNLVSKSTNLQENNEFVYIKRGSLGAKGRGLINEEALTSKLEDFGFTIVEPEKLTVDEIIKRCLNAKIIMGVEGSALAHGFLCINENGAMISLIPENRFNNPYRDYCNVIGIKYGFLVGRTVDGGFSIDLEDVEELLNIVSV
jgi:hypothetical protein